MAETLALPVACFAPELTEEMLIRYAVLINDTPTGELQDALSQCYDCVKTWWDLPVSTRKDGKRWAIRIPEKDSAGNVVKDDKGAPVRKDAEFTEVPLEAEHVKLLWDKTPWIRELVAMEPLLDSIDPVSQKELRDCAYHLNWYCREITRDREPLTQACLPA